MAKHGTASMLSIAQFREFSSAVLRHLPCDLDPAAVQQMIERQDDLRERLQRAFAAAPAARLVKTLAVTCEGNQTASQLRQRGKYNWSNDLITDERFPIPPHAPVTDELELFQFDHDPSWEDMLAERTRRNLGEPTYEHGLYLGIQHRDEQRAYPIVVTHQPVRDLRGNPGVLVLYGSADNRGLSLDGTRSGWVRHYVFVGVRKVA